MMSSTLFDVCFSSLTEICFLRSQVTNVQGIGIGSGRGNMIRFLSRKLIILLSNDK